MPQPAVTKERVTEVLSQLYTAGYPHCTLEEAARQIGIQRNTASHYVNEFARRFGIEVRKPVSVEGQMRRPYPWRIEMHIENGVVIPFSDAHYWPGEASTAHRALLECIKEFTPRAVIANGDIFDGASISRHPRIGWESRPTIKQEIEIVTERLGEISGAARAANLVYHPGNHCLRVDSCLSANVPQFEGVRGMSLREMFPEWNFAMRTDISRNLVVKHRWRGGIGAARNNALHMGVSICTGHLHAQASAPITNFHGTHWGIDCGMIADKNGPQFVYTEDNETGWREGFPVLTFRHGKLMPPDFVHVTGPDEVWFRGKPYLV